MTAKEEAPLLELRGLNKSFGPVHALANVNLQVPAGKVTALVGDNGAGKSVLIRTVSGIHAPDHGQILWEGQPRRIRTPREAADLGIETVYQDLALADNLDIVQNMFLGRERTHALLLDEESMETSAAETLAGLGDDRAFRLPAGGVRRVANGGRWRSQGGALELPVGDHDEPTVAPASRRRNVRISYASR